MHIKLHVLTIQKASGYSVCVWGGGGPLEEMGGYTKGVLVSE